MSRIRSGHTGLEQRLEALMRTIGLKSYVRSPANVVGKPDFVFRRRRLALFLDSCFWHGCPRHLRMPKSNLNYWRQKIANNRQRDVRQRRALKKQGWQVMRIWEHELKNPQRVLTKLTRILTQFS